MPNSIALFKNYVPILDEVYREASRTAVLDGAPELARAGANAGELIIPKMTMDGLADYARASGYVDGNVTLTNETVLCNFDRGRMFTVDALDDAETAGIAFGRLASEFIRTRVVPELDAFRFALLRRGFRHRLRQRRPGRRRVRCLRPARRRQRHGRGRSPHGGPVPLHHPPPSSA